MSNALLEYMAAGRPIVATAVGAAPDLIEDGVHGLLVPPGDAARLAEADRPLLREPELARRLGGGGAAARPRPLQPRGDGRALHGLLRAVWRRKDGSAAGPADGAA